METAGFTELLLKFSTMGGTINPYLGMAIFVIGLGFMIWMGIKAKNEAFDKQRKADGESASKDASKGQDSVQSGLDKTEDFLNKP
jgi:arginine exporter protein ArgO